MSCTDYTGDLYIEITNNCNLKCLHCYNDSTPLKGKRYITSEEFQGIIDKALDCNTKSIALSGGEPLLNPHLLDIISLILNKGLSCRIVTNGTLIDRSFLRSIGPSVSIQISLDGVKAESHERLTGVVGSFNDTVLAIELLNNMNIPYTIKSIISPYNCDELNDMVQFAIDHKAKGISFSLLQPYGRAVNNQDSLYINHHSILQLYLNKLLPLFNQYPGFVSGPKIQNTRCPLLCANDSQEQRFVVSPRIDVKGNVYPCATFISPKFAVGNIFKQSFHEIFSSKAFFDLITYMDLREKYVDECRNCIVSNFCGRGCPASSLETDSINSNYYCQMVKWKMMSDAVKGQIEVLKNEDEQ